MPDNLTVVVATRDRRESLLRTLDRLSDLPERPPVIVVDNASSDGTAQAVRSRHPRVCLVEAGRNLGAVARTVGARAAATPYVAFADDDSWWGPGALPRAARHLDAHPRVGLVAARVVVGAEARLDPVCASMASSPLGTRPGMPGPSVVGFVACGSVLRRKAFLDVGGFSPVLFFLGEEALLAQDLLAAGWGVVYAPDVVARHGPDDAHHRGDRRRLRVRNELLTTWLPRPWPVVVRETVGAACAVRDPAVRGGLVDAVARISDVVRARRRLPDEVEAAVRLVAAARG